MNLAEEIIMATLENHPEGGLTTINSDDTSSSSVIIQHKFSDYPYFFMTKDSTKKYGNLERNPAVSFMVF
ncbi:hypothetical protein MYP_4497 [Sporocytophaga myxococcoides]|uniref:Uncharacterized protein n=2 Tax=Sporocytophaga myxococcoides TaxID=153721 RepID=A0A098LLT0_9BACT|nr:hypothetical protein MYP_4497 [Sporocytophaga myxococcoides]